MIFNKGDSSTYTALYEEAKLTGKSLKQLCVEQGMDVQKLYDWKKYQKRKKGKLIVTKLVADQTEKNELQMSVDKSRSVFATIGLFKIRIPYADSTELVDILGAMKNV